MSDKNQNIIPIAIITDEKLPFTVAVTLISILENANPFAFCKFYCFVTGSVSKTDREKILSIQEGYKNCTIEIIDMNDKYLSSDNRHDTITNACLYKFAIAEKLPQYDKVLYIDTDVIVLDDLSALYEIELHNNYIGGVFNILYRFCKKSVAKMLDIPDLDSYINAGVMLMNLKLMRDDNLTVKLEQYIGKFQDSVDQHIFNKVCYGRILNIHPKYNVTISYAEFYETKKAQMFYSKGVLKDTINNPVIFHYAGKRKPWLYEDVPLSGKWHSYYTKSPYGKKALKRVGYRKKISPCLQIGSIKFFLFKFLTELNSFLYEKTGVSSSYYRYFGLLNKSLKQNANKRILLVTDDFSNENFIESVQKLRAQKLEIFIVGRKKCKNKNFEKKNVFVFSGFGYYFIFSMRFFKGVILNGVSLYKLAEKLNNEHVSYVWMIDDNEKIEKPSKKNSEIKRVISESKNVSTFAKKDISKDEKIFE